MREVITIDDSDDEDLKRAIALSLEPEASNPSPKALPDAPTFHADDRDEDDDFKRAIALSLQGDQAEFDRAQTTSHPESDAQSRPTEILGLDRKMMEEERLTRLSKKRQATLDGDSPAKKAAEPVGKRLKTVHQPEPAPVLSTSQQKPALLFPQGIIRKTWSPVHPRGGDIKIEEVLNADKVKLAVVCSYMWDLEWLFTKFKVRTAKLLFVMDACTDAEREERTREAEIVGRGRIGVCFPPLQGVAKMIHSKFMLLVYEDSLRLVVTSANLTPYDWGETGVLENVVFVIDLPRLPADAEEKMTFFGRELLYFLTKANLPDASLKSLSKFDFSATQNMAFVHSVAGSHSGPDMLLNGINSLSRAVVGLKLQPPAGSAPLRLDYATASLGALDSALLANLRRAANGTPMTTPAPLKPRQKAPAAARKRGGGSSSSATNPAASTPSRGEAPATEGDETKDDEDDATGVRVHFPSSRTVLRSRGGAGSAGTITFRAEWYARSAFPRTALRDHASIRTGMLSHAKVILAHSECSGGGGTTAWAYVGSANLSASAWGKVVRDRKGGTGEARLDVANWECGVLVPVPAGGERKDGDGERVPLHEDGARLRRLFGPVLDVPFELPGKRYGADDEPWFFNSRDGGQ